MFSTYLFRAIEMAVATKSANEIMRCFAEYSFERLHITTIKYFRVNSENKIELISAYGEMFAKLENYKYISRERKLPVADVINGGVEIYISSPAQLSAMYEEAKQWRELPTCLAIIPVKKLNVTVGCVSITLSERIETSDFIDAVETFRAFAYLLELLTVHELDGVQSLINLSSGLHSAQVLGGLSEKSQGTIRDNRAYISAGLELSDRQYQIARHIAGGSTNSAIARALGYSDATIRYETVKLYERLRVKNRSQASARIRELGIA